MCLECIAKDEVIKALQEKHAAAITRIESMQKQMFAASAKTANLIEMVLNIASRVKLNPTTSIEDAWMIADLKKLENETLQKH